MIRHHIVFKILLFVFEFFHNSLPIYLMDSLQVSERGEVKLKVPQTSTPYGDHAFGTEEVKHKKQQLLTYFTLIS